MRFTHLIVAVIFIAFGLVQLNDPDPYLWVIVYFGVAICAVGFYFRRYLKWLSLIGLVGCLIGVAMISPDFISWLGDGMPSIVNSMKAETPYIELVREFLGFLIAAVTYGIYYSKIRAIQNS